MTTPNPEVTYKPLPNDARTAQTLAEWNVAYWAKQFPTISAKVLAQEYIKAAKTKEDVLPTVLVAYVDGNLAGAIMIENSQLPKFKFETPWMGALIVNPEYRSLGIGRGLAMEGQRYAKKLGYKKIYAFTTHLTEWAERWDWTVLGKDVFRGTPVDVLEKSLHWDYLN